MTYLVVADGTAAAKVESQCYTYETEEQAADEAKELAKNGDRYNVFKLVQTHTFKGR